MDLVLGIILLVAAVFLIVAVLMQSGKSHNLSGSIAGGAETFFGKTKGKTIDKLLSKVTTVVAILFTLLVVVVYILQPNVATEEDHTGHDHEEITQTENADDHEDHDHADDTAAE